MREIIDKLLELNKKRTPGEWYKDISRSIFSVNEGKRLKVTNQDWFEDKERCVKHEDIDFIVSAPEMIDVIKKLQEENAKLKELAEDLIDKIECGVANDYSLLRKACELTGKSSSEL